LSTIEHLQSLPTRKKDVSRPFSCLAELLAHRARSTPDRDAILAPGRTPLTFGKLWACAQETLRALRSAGVGQSDRVAVVLPDGPDAAAAIVSVAAASVGVPLNPAFTTDEWQRYFAETRIAALLTVPDLDSPSRAVARARGISILDLSVPLRGAPGSFSITAAPARRGSADDFASSTDDAFILLTSGTTSRPKTIPLTHAAVCQSAYNVGATIELGPQDRLLSVLPLFHGHGLISGVIAALAAGSSVVCTPGFDAAAFFNWLTEFRPTWYTAVPTIHRAVLEAAERHKERARQSSLRLIRSASSTLPPKVLRGLEVLFDVPVIDTFGMTEAATQIAANPLQRRKPGSVGVAVGAEIAILDDVGRQLSSRQRGEIALRGPTITRGYDNDDAATREAFRGGWFRTGDLGYLDRDGYLFIVGRVKEVINRGGQKVAPGEVEDALLRHPDVIDAAVYAAPHERLEADVAAAVVLRPDAKVNAQKLRSFVRKRLADFKVPGLIQIVPEIPKGAGGKIKRAELAAALAVSEPAGRRREKAAPCSQLEREIAKIWSDLLELEQIGNDQDVFALGVDSITVTQMISRLRECFGVDLSFKDIFQAPTVAALAARLQRSKKSADSASSSLLDSTKDNAHAEKYRPQPVSVAQEHMLRIEREVPGLPQFNLLYAYRLQGPLNVTALERSLVAVVHRHESLRAQFAWREKTPIARIVSRADIKISLIVGNFAASSPAGNHRTKALLRKKAELEGEQEALTPFDVSRAPLFRARLLRLGANDHVLHLVLHHVAIDGWSMGVFLEEVAENYAAFVTGRPAQLSEPALQFSDFSRWQRQWSISRAGIRQFAYWKSRLRRISPLFPTIPDIGSASRNVGQKPVHLPNHLAASLRAISCSQGVTLFMTLLTGFKALLLLRTGRNDICVATTMANRSQLGTDRVIGPFANTTVIRARLDLDLPFQEALNRVRDALVEAYAKQEFPFEMLASRLAEEERLDVTSIVQAFFLLQNAFRQPFKLPNVATRPLGYWEGRQVMPIDRTWLALILKETPSGIAGACRYRVDLFEPNRLEHWITDYKQILAKAAANPKISLGRLAER
jgi:acyl-CoA synthetase (AMP-forming)/AMP-acid ligase II/acyl carrier protein/NRPS condensation-like uncharacterized protein